MPLKSGSSHGLALLVCTIAAALIVEVLRPAIPQVLRPLTRFSATMVKTFQLPIRADTLAIILVATVLAVVWGIFYELRRDRD